MISSNYGLGNSVTHLKEKFPIGTTGLSLINLVEIAQTIGFGTRALKVELEGLSDINLPAILHWDLNHFVVLERVSKNSAVIHDPAKGKRLISFEKLSNHFTGIVIELSPLANFNSFPDQPKLQVWQLWSKFKGLKAGLLQILILSILIQVIALVTPLYLQVTIDKIIPGSDVKLLGTVSLAFLVVYVLNAVSEALRSWVILTFGERLVFQSYGNVISHLIKLPLSFFEKRHIGDIYSRIESLHPIKNALTQTVISALIDSVLAVTTLCLLFYYSPIMASVVGIFTAVYVVISFFIFPELRRREESALDASAIEQTHVFETVQSVRAIKLFVREAARASQWRNLYSKVLNANVAKGSLEIFYESSATLIFGLQLVAVVYLGGNEILNNEFSVGKLFAFITYQYSFALKARELVTKGLEFRMLGLHLERLSDIVFSDPEPVVNISHLSNDKIFEIQLKNVTYRYAHNLPVVLKDVSLTISSGEYIAIVGASGGGKTTFLKTLLGLSPPVEGQVLINGDDLYKNYGPRRWRNSVSVIMQDDILLSGTIAENISFFEPGASLDEVKQAAYMAKIHEVIEALPMKYETIVSELAAGLSGGQKQRVLLARAFFRQPQVLILDEGTANLDPHTEGEIAEAIANLNITRIIITHTPTLLRKADTIYELVDGDLHRRSLKDVIIED